MDSFILIWKFQFKAEKMTGLDFHKVETHFIKPTQINSLDDFFKGRKRKKRKNVELSFFLP